MKILIVGKNSYIGNHIDKWLSNSNWDVSQLDAQTSEWMNYDYSSFDSVIYVAGIVHRPKCKDWELYKRVNADIPAEIALKAKQQGVSSFVYLSSMAVYGKKKKLSPVIIDKQSQTTPSSFYGRSKLLAEDNLLKLQSDNFDIIIVRPPNVYGRDCMGGYISGYTSAVRKLPVLPKAFTNIRQSLLYIDNLSELIRLCLSNKLNGVFCPQDDIAVSANALCSIIATTIGKTLRSSSLLGWMLQLFRFIPIVRKAYGGIEYSKSLSEINNMNYVVVPLKEGIKRTLS